MSSPHVRPVRRLIAKTTTLTAYARIAQDTLPPALMQEQGDAKKQVYLITISHPTQTHGATSLALKAPDSYNHKALLDALLDACAQPSYDSANRARNFGGVRLIRCVVAAEYHKTDAASNVHKHYHIAVQASHSFRWKAVKVALL